jgi:hypothetical protein
MSILNAPEGILKMLIRKYELWEVEVSEDWEIRKEVCQSCPKKVSAMCGECGCLIEAKVLIKLESCPLGKW